MLYLYEHFEPHLIKLYASMENVKRYKFDISLHHQVSVLVTHSNSSICCFQDHLALMMELLGKMPKKVSHSTSNFSL